MSAFNSITKGLTEALAFADGDKGDALVHKIIVPDVDIAKIRRKTGLSQAEFAQSIGVAKGTLLNWEHGRRRPSGPAHVLLALIAQNPKVVQDMLP
ncbi:MAG: helix-turn-helix domain-containing protein [Alphaproteobacteria bacterium]|nr:helix-turn-helix domain-containing protein [Alphaproteobacteria bacterium]